MNPPNPGNRPGMLIVLSLLAVVRAAAAYEMPTTDFIVFPTAAQQTRFENHVTGDVAEHHTDHQIDFFLYSELGRAGLLVEYLVADEATHGTHVERLQLQWAITPRHRFRIGRMHNPLGYWNMQYHHGHHLETSATRPAFLTYEEEGGFLPLHIAGLSFEGETAASGPRLHYDLALGAGPEWTGAQLHPFDIMRPGEESHGAGATARLLLLPYKESPTAVGAFAGLTNIPSADPAVDDMRQEVAGITGNWESGAARLLGSVFHVATDLGFSGTSSFGYAYLQAEYTLHPVWTIYGRLTGSGGTTGDPYLVRFAVVPEEEALAGARYDFIQHQALKFELSRNHLLAGSYDRFIVQWSAAF